MVRAYGARQTHSKTLPHEQSERSREFKGGRNAEAVEKFLHKVIGPPVIELEDADSASSFAANNEVTFVLFGSGSEDELGGEYAKRGEKYLDTLYLARCTDASLFPDLTAPETPAVAAINSASGAAQWYTAASTVRCPSICAVHLDGWVWP